MKKYRAYDCSNSPERPSHHIESMGPKENDVMRGLKKHCSVFNYEFVDDPTDADVIITNDVYPKDILTLNKPKVKRMDGVYWSNSLKERNDSLNKAALESDWVIFISEYSRESYLSLYGRGMRHLVITNCVDGSVFFPYYPMNELKDRWVATASNWARPEKRFNDLMVFTEKIISDRELILIGKCEFDVPSNVRKMGYIDDEVKLNRILNEGNKFINLSYRDAAPKTVCQAVSCAMPILYADSGGVKELICSGVPITDAYSCEFEDEVPRLDVEKIRSAYKDYMANYPELCLTAKHISSNYMTMLYDYFEIMSEVIHEQRS